MILTTKFTRQRGSEDVMIYLSKEANKQGVKSVLFLMPCHSTPYYSTLHHDLPMRFLDCTPRWLSSEIQRLFLPWHTFPFLFSNFIFVTSRCFVYLVPTERLWLNQIVFWWIHMPLRCLCSRTHQLFPVTLCYLVLKNHIFTNCWSYIPLQRYKLLFFFS